MSLVSLICCIVELTNKQIRIPNQNIDLKDTLIIAGNDYSNIEAKTVWGALRGDFYITLLLTKLQ